MSSVVGAVEEDLRTQGIAHVRGPLDGAGYRELAAALGAVIAEERIALRPGAHAYVAKPGRVPLHTDHPEVNVIGWLCEAQDDADGASLLFDARPMVQALSDDERGMLRIVELECPPLAGGPPILSFPVLKPRPQGDALFVSPWLRSARPVAEQQQALDAFREQLSAEAKHAVVDIRLSVGDALFIDNHRVLHGRRAIAETSRRRLHRLWIRMEEVAAPSKDLVPGHALCSVLSGRDG